MTSVVKLGELFRVGSSKRVLKSQWKKAGVPFYRGREITRLAADGLVENEIFISESLYQDLSDQYGVPDAEDIMITAIGTIGNSYVVREGDRFYFKDASVLWLKKTADVSSAFINYWLKSCQFLDQLERGNGATVDTLTIQKLQSVSLDLPPLATQRRIVAILDEAFEAIATAKANTEKNLRNARELFDAALAQTFQVVGDGRRLAECATEVTDGDHAPPPKSKDGIPFITISNVEKSTRTIDFQDTFKVSAAYYEALKPNRKPRSGDVLYTVTGSFGIPILVQDDREFCFQRHIGLIRPKPDTDSQWLAYALLSPQVRAQADETATGTAQRTVSLGALRAFVVPNVALNEQIRVVEHLNKISDRVTSAEKLAACKLAALDELKQSLLHQAFNGQLS